MRVSQNNGTIMIKYDNASISKGAPNSVQLQIPKNLLGGINFISTGVVDHFPFSKFRVNNDKTNVTYSLQPQTFSTVVTIRLNEPTAEFVIHGTKILSHLIHNYNQ